MVEVIEWITTYLKSPYGVPNTIRFSKETEQPPAATGVGGPLATRQVSLDGDGDNLRITVDIGDDVGLTGAAAPMSPRSPGVVADAEPLGEVV